MARRIADPVVRRPSVPLTEQDEADLAKLHSDPAYRRALSTVSPEGDSVIGEVRESLLLHAVLQAGFAAIEQAVQQSGYDELAREYESGAAASRRRRVARRRPPGWSDSP